MFNSPTSFQLQSVPRKCPPINCANCTAITSSNNPHKSSTNNNQIISKTNTSKAVLVRQLNLTYQTNRGPEYVLTNVNLSIAIGSIYGLLGPSGCGKTSLLKCLMGLKFADNGKINIFGNSPNSKQSNIPGPLIGYMPQEIALDLDLTIRETWSYFGRVNLMHSKTINQRISEVANILDLNCHLDRLIGNLSGGQQRRASFGASVLHQPQLLILDEPTVGVDPLLRSRIWLELKRLTRENQITIIITTHYIEEARQANMVAFMRKGTILIESSPNLLLQKYQVDSLESVFLLICEQHKRNSLHFKLFKQQTIKGNTCNNCSSATLKKSNYHLITSLLTWFYQFRAIYYKYLLQLVRQPETLVASFLLPVIILSIFCVCIGGTPASLPIGIINHEYCADYGDDDAGDCLSTKFITTIDSYVFKKINYSDYYQALADVEQRKLWAVVRINNDFSEAVKSRITFSDSDYDGYKINLNSSLVTINADLTDFLVSLTLQEKIFDAYQATISSNLFNNSQVANLPILIASTIYGTYSKSDFFGVRDFGGPGLMIVIVYCVSFALTAFALLLEKRNQTLNRNFAAGISKNQLILANLLTRFVFTSIASIILLLLSINLLDIPCRGSQLAAIFMLLLQNLSGMSLGILLASITPDMFTCCVLANGYLIFTFIISGVMWPTEGLPYYLKWFSSLQATTQAAESFRSILIRGQSVTTFNVYSGYITSTIWIMINLIVSNLTLKLQDE